MQMREHNELRDIMKEADWKERYKLRDIIREYGTKDYKMLKELIKPLPDTKQIEINWRILRELQLLTRKINSIISDT